MRGQRYAWAMIMLAAGWAGAPVRAGVTVTGDTRDGSDGFYVGYNANSTGALVIDAGKVFSRYLGFLGWGVGSTGTAAVTGAGSQWAISTALYVGCSGSGTLTVSDGGRVNATTLYAPLSSLYGDGTITASGAVLDADLIFDANHGTRQTLPFGSGGTLQLNITSTSTVGAGYSQSGSFRIAAGSSVASTTGYLGYNPGSTGTAIVSGAGSKWTNSGNLNIGYSGGGALRVEAGGQINSGYFVGGYLGYNSGSTGNATVTGAGSTWTNSGLYVGYQGTGTLNVEAGGRVSGGEGSNAVSYLGYNSGSSGTATVTGVGSQWTNSSEIDVGRNGTGTLRVDAGGQVSSGAGYIGYGNSSSGRATVTGAGSKWLNSGLYVGYSGSGTLRVEGGGQVSSRDSYIAYNLGSTGNVTVTGAGSQWTNSGMLYLGYHGKGTLTVSDGGRVTTPSLRIVGYESKVRLHVSGDSMLEAGNIVLSGPLSFLADAFLPAGTYRPIGQYTGLTLSFLSGGSTLGVGGAWDLAAETFTVAAPVAVNAGIRPSAGGQRLIITDVSTGNRAGVSFGWPSGGSLVSLPLSDTHCAALMPLLQPEETILSGWEFAGRLTGGEALLSLDAGRAARDLHLWRLSQGAWSAYTPEMMTYDAHGILSFTVDPASLNAGGYALSAMVPEPAALGLAMIGGLALLTRRRQRR